MAECAEAGMWEANVVIWLFNQMIWAAVTRQSQLSKTMEARVRSSHEKYGKRCKFPLIADWVNQNEDEHFHSELYHAVLFSSTAGTDAAHIRIWNVEHRIGNKIK